MESHSQVLLRPKRASKRPPLSDDFIDNIDIEIEAIESMPHTVARPMTTPLEGGPRKRGRPRKYPLAPPPPVDVQPVKRPRGRPKGSGKHQRGAAMMVSGATYDGATSTGGVPTESGVTSMAISAAPSITLPNAPPTAKKGLESRKQAFGTPALSFTGEDLPHIPLQNGHATPHFPPQDARPSESDDSPPHHQPHRRTRAELKIKEEERDRALLMGPLKTNMQKSCGECRNGCAGAQRSGALNERMNGGSVDDHASGPVDLASIDACTPTPRPRNRRKGGVPTKTE